MGIPSFYKWIQERYPRAVMGSRHCQALDYDNLYLDMNGIIHPCFHPEGLPAPKTYEEVFQAVFKYVDRVFSIVRPRKLLYLAIDGVAPRAKMNQQRSRRFRAAKDAAEEADQKKEVGDESIEKSSSKLDSNVITPGTEFMALLSSALRYYIHLRMNGDPRWQGIKVILSDASVPGEGEHKIMSYIRLQRNLPGFDPNTRHCLYGLDADLIMLALASHEIHFSILREDVQQSGAKDAKSSKSGRPYSKKNKRKRVRRTLESEKLDDYISKQKFQFLHIWILRHYLSYAMKIPDPTVNGDLERLIDDFVLICLFVGNDFLPNMPSLQISEGAIDLLMTIYKREFVRMGGYLTDSFEVNLGRVKHFLEAVGCHEGLILRKRMQMKKVWAVHDRRSSQKKVVRTASVDKDSINSSAMKIQAPNNYASISTNPEVDKIKFGEEGWKERYYAEKFEAETEDDCQKVRRDVVLKYTEGICWVMHYYYEGVCSWQWFYPYHYAPFPSDFVGIDELKIQFTLGEPFKPFEQLMAVLPAASAHALPLFYRKLMTDASSPLLAFYPTDFELDMNGKRFSWQAICKLPFIDETSLLSEVARVESTLTDEERQRNNLGLDVLFVHASYSLAMEIVSFHRENVDHLKLTNGEIKWKINPEFSGGMNGYIILSNKPVQPMQIDSPIDGMDMIADNKVLSVFYKCPPFHVHIPRPPEAVQYPDKYIRKKDIKPVPLLLHEKSAVVGRLHSLRPIRNSITGSRLAKSARLLVSKWYLEIENQQKSKGVVECGEGATIDGSCAGGDGECVKGKTREHKQESSRKPKQNSVGENGPASISNKAEATSIDDTRDDKNCSNGGAGGHNKNCSNVVECNSELGDVHVGENGPASISNKAEAASIVDTRDDKNCSNGGAGVDNKNCTNVVERNSELGDFHVGENGPASDSNKAEAASIDDTRDDKNCSNGGDSRCIGGIYVGENGPASVSTTGEAVSIDDTRDDKSCSIGGAGGKSRKRKRKSKSKQNNDGEVREIYAGENGPASISNTIEAVSVDYTRGHKSCSNGGDGTCISDEAGTGLPGFYSSDDKGTSILNLGEIPSAGDNEDDGGDGKSSTGKSRGEKRKRKKSNGIEVSDVSVGADGPASTLSFGETSVCVNGDAGGDDKSIRSKSRRLQQNKKQSSGVELPDVAVGAIGLALISNVGETISGGDTGVDKHCSNDWPGEQADGILHNLGGNDSIKRIEGGNESNGNCIDCKGIMDRHVGEDGLTSHLNPEETVFVNGIGGDKKCLTKGQKRRMQKKRAKARAKLSISDSGSVQIPESTVFVGVTECDKMSIDLDLHNDLTKQGKETETLIAQTK